MNPRSLQSLIRPARQLRRRIGPGRERRQRGQALVLGMALLVVMALLTFFLFSSGQVSATRTRLVNATDAAAYSAGLWRARAMNYYAYSNRAIVANEVAIAQAVTMVSYTRFLQTGVERINRVAQLGGTARVLTAALTMATERLSALTRYTALVDVAVRSGYNQALAGSQEAIFLMTNAFALSSVAQEVVAESDPAFHAFVLPVHLLGDQVISRRYTEADRARLRDVVMRSLDGYSRERSGRKTLGFCWFRAERRGQTEMVLDHENSLDRWQAYDTLALHRARWPCRWRESTSLAWGGAEAAIEDEARATLDALNGLNPALIHEHKRTNSTAYRRAGRARDFWSTEHYFGLPSVRGLDYESSALKDNPRFPLIRVGVLGRVRRQAAVGTAQDRQLGAGRVQPGDRFAGEFPMLALSAAEVYFRRPPAADGRVEYASLYSPYWQVRLAPVPESWRQAVLIYQSASGAGGAP